MFARAFFEVELTRLRGFVEKLEKGPFHFGSFPLARYFQIRGERLGAIGSEMDVCQIVDEAVGCLVDLGKTLTSVLSLRCPRNRSRESRRLPSRPVSLQGKAFSVPHESQVLAAPSFLAGKTVGRRQLRLP